MIVRRVRVLLVALAALLAGCTLPDGDDGNGTTTPTATQEPPAITVTFAGRVVDALSGEPVDDAVVLVDLADTRPCQQESVIWNQWEVPVDADGAFGPFQQPAPNSPTYRFFLHVESPGYTKESMYVGPEQVAAVANATIVLHPRVAVNGTAPPGTVLAMTTDGFPRFTVTGADGAWRLDDARTDEVQLVAATRPPRVTTLTPPASWNATAQNATTPTGWQLQGVVQREDGRPHEARVVAWNGTRLWAAALTDEVGRFLLELPATPAELRIEARDRDDAWGGVLARDVNGPPASVETVLVRPLC